MKRAFKYLFENKTAIIIGYIIKISGTVVGLFIPRIMGTLIDDVVPRLRETGDWTEFVLGGVFMAFCAVFDRTFNIIANRRAAKYSMLAIRHLRNDLYQKILSLSGKQTDEFGIPSLVSRLTSDSYNIHTFFNIMQRMGVRSTLICIGGLILSATLDLSLTLTLVATLPFVFAIVFFISRRGIPLYSIVQTSVDKMVRIMREDVSGIRVIKALSKEDYERERFDDANSATVKDELKASGVMAISGPIISLCLNMGLVLVIVIGAYRVNAGAVKAGTIIAFLTYFTMILNSLIAVNRIFINYSKASASAKRIYAVMDAEDDLKVAEWKDSDAKDGITSPYRIEFRHVWFCYGDNKENDEEKYVLKDIDFTLAPGESLGIIGATGSGKTTIISLLMRYYDPTRGEIFIDGRNIKTYPLDSLRKMFGVAFQNDIIFAEAIDENIRFGREISDEDVEMASKAACAYEFIMGKENGFKHEAAIKGADFSGGQKQRLFISRALAGHPGILILDDSSSALDYKTDADVRENINENFGDCTLISVAQRISSVMKMSKIMVIEDGAIIGLGTHEELLANNEVYKEIASTQLGSLL
ncbi:MAG: ABC transporter ATP-binding protein/permease [Lachnospiraceae bacterium]|nr:ABC transporter ATP-binding protein/permease [Lachnospiraceae bacterium]